MAYFIRGTGESVTPTQHSMDIFKQYILGCYFSTLIGKKGSGKPIIADDTTLKQKGKGDTARYHFIPQNFGAGIEGQNASIEGNEEYLDEYYMDLKIDQITKAFAKKGKMTDLRTIWDIRAEYKSQLANWFKWRTENDIIDAITGFSTDGVTKLTAAQKLSTAVVNGEGRCIRADATSFVTVTAANSTGTALLAAMDSTDKMNTTLLDNLQSFAKTAGTYPMQPIKLSNGEEYYMLLISPKAAVDLRADTRWEKRSIALMTGGGNDLSKDPIATGAMGVWGRIIVKEADYIKTQTNGTITIARNLLLGADAAVMAYAQPLDYTEELRDHKRIMSMAADEIRGVKKFVFNSIDLNVAQVPSIG